MKTKAYEIIIVMLVLFLLAACFGCKDEAEATEPNETNVFTIEHLEIPDILSAPEPNEHNLIFVSEQSTPIAEINLKESLDFTFFQDGEELNFDYSEPNIYTYDFEPEKAISFIINALYKCWVSDEDVVVRYEPNEPKILWEESGKPYIDPMISNEFCKHENLFTCGVGGCGCWTCMDCGKHSEETKIYFKED